MAGHMKNRVITENNGVPEPKSKCWGFNASVVAGAVC